MKAWVRACLLVAFALVLAALPALASSEGGASTSPENTKLGWGLRIVNFAVLFGGLMYLMRGAPAFFRRRAEHIGSAITDAKRVKDEADRQLRDAQTKFARLDQEVATMRVTAKQDGVAEAERIRAMAREEEAKIQRAALAEIDAAERAARMELKAAAARMAVERAEAIVKGKMTPDVQSALVRVFVENLGEGQLRAVAQRYARALVDVALKAGQAEPVRSELAAFAQVVKESAALRNALASPAIGRDKKQAILAKLASQMGVGKTVRNFLMILVNNRRAQLLPEIREAYDQQMNLRMGVADAEVTSARELSADEKAKLTAALGKMTGKRVQAQYKQDAALIGGTIVRVGSTIYNGSVRDQLRRMREKLAAD